MAGFKVTLTQLALLLVSFAGFAQSGAFYTDMYLEPTGEIGGRKGGYATYDLGKVIMFNGLKNNAKFFYIEDALSGKRLFSFTEEEIKAARFDPKFFKANDELPIVLMLDLETSFSWGQHIFIIDGKEITHCGFLPYGADNFNFSNLGLYAQFSYKGEYFVLTLREDVKYIDYVTDDLIDASKLKFKVEKNKITRIN